MTQLALAVDADDELWTLDALPTPEAPYVEVGSELVEVRARFPSQTYTLTGQELPPKIRVRRGIAGTTAATHDIAATLTPTYGLGSGVATLPGVQISATDPGGTGLWIRVGTSPTLGVPVYGLFARADENDPWTRVNIGEWDADDVLRTFIGSPGVEGTIAGFDILNFDANDDQTFQLESVGDGGFSLVAHPADFDPRASLVFDADGGTLVMDLQVDSVQVGVVYMSADGLALTDATGNIFQLSATGVAVTTAGTFTYNGAEVATVP